MTATFSVTIGGTTYDNTNHIFNPYIKNKLNQVGRFEFDAHSLTAADEAILCELAIVTIKVRDVTRFEGYINKVVKDKKKRTWHFEGPSLAGIFDTKVTRVPVILQCSGDMVTAKQVLHQCVFRFGAFYNIGVAGFKIVGGDGCDLFFYKVEARSVLDHIVNLAKISGYDWRVYLDI